ncbi:MAG TPA: hypothetical protein VGD19_11365 [Allosphingosinicella sp.]|jgi:hypothetical protein
MDTRQLAGLLVALVTLLFVVGALLYATREARGERRASRRGERSRRRRRDEARREQGNGGAGA